MRPEVSFLLLVCVTSVHAWGNNAKKAKPTQPEFCRKPPFVGSCRPIGKPWYYDAGSKRCQQISVGLCSAGNNRFLSPEKCKTVCESSAKNIPEACLTPPVTVPCGQVRHAWYFDLNSTSCKMLSYTDPACDSAGNRFLSEMKCQSVCLPTVKPKPTCSRDPEPDMCLVSRKHWFFNFRDNVCMKFKNGCGKGPNSFATYEKCMSKCSYNQVPGVPSQVGPLIQPAQPSIPVQPGQPSRPGLGLPNQTSHSGLPPQSSGSGLPTQPSSVGAPGYASSTFPPSTPVQSGQPDTPNIGSPNKPGHSGPPPKSAGSGLPTQPSSVGGPGHASSTFPSSTPVQSDQSSRPSAGLPGQQSTSSQSRPGQPVPPGVSSKPTQVSPIFPPSTTALSGPPTRVGVGQQGYAGAPLLTGSATKPVQSGRPASPVRPGYGRR